MKNLFCKTSLIFAVLLVCISAFAQKPERPAYKDLRYEDHFTFKYGVSYARDPWTWGYTKEFADRFRMPTKWIEPELTGILAIAFRVTNAGQIDTCGLGGQENNCWPKLTYQVDIYYDNRIRLPWIPEVDIRDNLMDGISSKHFLYNAVSARAKRYNYVIGAPGSHWEKGPSGIGAPLMSFSFSNSEGFGREYRETLAYYDREFLPNIGLIGFVDGAGPLIPFRSGPYWLDFFSNPEAQTRSKGLPRSELKAIGLVHEAYIPETYMKRVNESLAVGAKSQDEIIKRLIREFQQRQK